MFKDLNGSEYIGYYYKEFNYDINKDINQPNSVIYNDNLYVFWIEYKGSPYQLRYKYFDGATWNTYNGSLNYDVNQFVQLPYSIVYNNKLYVFWTDRTNGYNQIRYKYYDGIKWNDDNGSLNYDINNNASETNSIIYNNKLYVFWQEGKVYNGSRKQQLRYKYYDGAKWNNDLGGLNYDVNNNVNNPKTVIYNNNLYVFWQERSDKSNNNHIRYKYYNGIKWSQDNDVLNYDVSKNTGITNSIVFNDNLYIFWHENDGIADQIRYKYYDGEKWHDDNSSLNYKNSAGYPNSIIYNNDLYVFWSENSKIRYKSYDGIKWCSDNGGLNYDMSKHAYLCNIIVYSNNLYILWKESNGTSYELICHAQILNIYKYLIKNNNSICQINPLSKLQNITQSNLTSETFMEYGSNKLILTENEYNELSEDAEVLVYNSSQKELKLHKNITYDKRFIMTLDKPKIRIKPNNLDSKPKLMLNAHRLMEYKYDVKIDTLEKPIKEVIGIKYDIDDEAVIRKDTFKTSENPYVATITVEQENGDIVKNSGNLTLYNREPKLLITMTGMLMRLEIGDDDKNKIKYRMLLNGKQIYPLDGDWSNYFDTPYSIARKFKSNEISVGRNNVIQVFVKDEYEKQSSLTYNFIGEYSGLLFCDELGGYYSDDLGNIVKRLNFGNILAGKTSEVKTVYLKNACGYNIKDVVIKVTENLIPSGSDILIDSEKDNFIGSHEIKIDKLPNKEVIPFYIKVKTDIEQEQGGRFEITVNSTSSEI